MLKRLTPLCLIVLAVGLTACEAHKRRALNLNVPPALCRDQRERLSIYIQPAISNRPLSETVWDNISGPVWDVKESKQLGYSLKEDDEEETSPATVFEGVPPAESEKTRIIIPFGRIFYASVQGAAKACASRPRICETSKCAAQFSESVRQVILNVKKFQVSEYPVNHLNYELQATCQGKMLGSLSAPRKLSVKVKNRKLSGSSANQLLKSMNSSANDLTQLIMNELLAKCF